MRVHTLTAIAGSLLLPAVTSVPLVSARAAPAETVTPTFMTAIPNVPGKSFLAAVVEYPPGGVSPPHRHAASAFVYAFVLSGTVRSQVDDAPVRVFHTGESWFEPPGAHHGVSENASAADPARLLAIFVVDSGDTTLTTPDK